MNLEKLVPNLRAGKLAKITGTSAELKAMREKISLTDKISVTSGPGCLYVYRSSPVVFLPLSCIPRQ